MIDTILVVVAIKLAIFIAFGFYNRWWRYVSTRDMWGAARGVTAACIVADLIVYFAHPIKGFPLPRSIAVARLADPARVRRRHAPDRAQPDRAARRRFARSPAARK